MKHSVTYWTLAFLLALLAGSATDGRAQESLSVTPMPDFRSGASAATIEGRIYVVGGTGLLEDVMPDMLRYDVETDRWEVLPERPEESRTNAAFVAHDEHLYLLGGRTDDDDITTTVERYNVETNTWEQLPSLLHPREGLSAVVLGDTLFALGGLDEQAAMPLFAEKLALGSFSDQANGDGEEDESEWEPVEEWTLDSPRVSAGAVATEEAIFFFGGIVPSSGPVTTAYVLTPGASSEVLPAGMAFARGAFATVTDRTKVYIMGGVGRNGNRSTIEVYDTVQRRWTSFGDGLFGYLLRPRRDHAAASVDGVIYVIGGEDSGGVAMRDVETVVLRTDVSTESPSPVPETASLSVYPHPVEAHGTLEISLQTPEYVSLRILDLQGRERLHVSDAWYPVGQHDIPLILPQDGSLASGLYMVELRSGTQRLVQPFVVTR